MVMKVNQELSKINFILREIYIDSFEGMLIAAWAVEAKDIYIYLRDEYPGIRDKYYVNLKS